MKLLTLFFAWLITVVPSWNDGPPAVKTYERCIDRVSERTVLVERADGAVRAAYDGEGVKIESNVELEHCVALTRHQFRSERRYRRLLAP